MIEGIQDTTPGHPSGFPRKLASGALAAAFLVVGTYPDW
jgi:hypothetical protein